MERAKQLRTIAWMIAVCAMTTAVSCVLHVRDGECLLALLSGATSLFNVYAFAVCRKGLRRLKNEQDAGE